MLFKRAVQRYGHTPLADTPYKRAQQLWDERIGSARVQARNWRLMAFGSLCLAAGLAAAFFWQAQQSRIVPYVVAVDTLGEARAIGPADKHYRPSDPQIAWFLSRFISDVRTVSLDPVLMRQTWLSAYAFATKRGAAFLDTYARASRPFDQLGKSTVSVAVTSVVRASDTSFQVKWVENRYARGALTNTSHWTAILTVVRRLPGDADTLRQNPLGLYVDAIDWSRELEPNAATSTVSPSFTAHETAERDLVAPVQPSPATKTTSMESRP